MKTVLFVVALSGLCVRAQPSTEAPVVAVEPFATQVEGIVEDGWLMSEDGYMKAEWLSEDDPLAEYTYLGDYLTTAYTHTGSCCADGSYPEAGYSVATNVLPFGTTLYISGVGMRTVTDRGPRSMPDEWLDIFMDGYSECVSYGMQTRGVWVVPEGGGSND